MAILAKDDVKIPGRSSYHTPDSSLCCGFNALPKLLDEHQVV